MTAPLTIWVPGLVKPKGRPRVTRTGHAYTPSSTRSYEARVALAAEQAMTRAGLHEPLTGPLRLRCVALLPVPASWSNRQRQRALSGQRWPTGRPDLDNVIKIVDALNGIVFQDDSQIVALQAMKQYAEKPGLVLLFDVLDPQGPENLKS